MTTVTAGGSGAMFDRIAERYDLLNRLMSLGLDRRWRRRLIRSVGDVDTLLDVATGTGDVAIMAAKMKPKLKVVGLDPASRMLDIGRTKVAARGLQDRITLHEGDALALPFEDQSFGGATIAFGIRNVIDRPRALRELLRVVKPGGMIGVLELTEPRRGPLASLARVHIHRIIPALGAWLSGDAEYKYLARSIAAFPPVSEFTAIMSQVGLQNVRAEAFCFGAVHLFTGETPRRFAPR